jgi:hypothetical protein
MSKPLIAASALIIGFVAVWIVLDRRQPAPKPSPPIARNDADRDAPHPENQPVRPSEPSTAPIPAPDARSASTARQPDQSARAMETPKPPAPAPKPRNNDPKPANPQDALAVIPLPIAREALGLVGTDPDAEQVWATAINDPALSPKARQDLIEDLNEDGFPDPRHVTEEDLPLIVSRLALIEDLAPDAMDEINAAAFAEAYKDLVNMYVRLTRQ